MFGGRAGLGECWAWFLFRLLAIAAAFMIDFGLLQSREPVVFTLTFVVLILPSRSVAVRRLHDINRSGR